MSPITTANEALTLERKPRRAEHGAFFVEACFDLGTGTIDGGGREDHDVHVVLQEVTTES